MLYLNLMYITSTGTKVIRLGEFRNEETFKKAFKSLKNTLIACNKNFGIDYRRTLVYNDYYVIISD